MPSHAVLVFEISRFAYSFRPKAYPSYHIYYTLFATKNQIILTIIYNLLKYATKFQMLSFLKDMNRLYNGIVKRRDSPVVEKLYGRGPRS